MDAALCSTEALAALTGQANCLAHPCCGVLGLTSLLRFDAKASELPLAAEVVQAESSLITQALQPAVVPVVAIGS
jgi:hypothetical protein